MDVVEWDQNIAQKEKVLAYRIEMNKLEKL